MNVDVTTSVEDDLKKHFSVLFDLSHKFDDYTTIPTIPFEHRMGEIKDPVKNKW
jgi:hypothetical protein